MSVSRTLDGWLVRRECKRLVASEADALRLDRLYADAFDAANGRFVGGLSACPRIIEALDDYVAHLRVERANQKVHLQAVRKRLERFARELSNGAGDVSVDKIAASDVKAWREKRLGEKGKRIKAEQALFQRLWDEVLTWEDKQPPTADLNALSQQTSVVRSISHESIGLKISIIVRTSQFSSSDLIRPFKKIGMSAGTSVIERRATPTRANVFV